jgi:ribonuclease P protein component
MLAKQNRVVRAADFRAAIRRGTRVPARCMIVHIGQPATTRFGFVIPKTVGNAVVRNTIRRRLRAAGGELLATHPLTGDVVVRVLPGAADLDWPQLRDEFAAAVERGSSR